MSPCGASAVQMRAGTLKVAGYAVAPLHRAEKLLNSGLGVHKPLQIRVEQQSGQMPDQLGYGSIEHPQ
jgi:hypothetical protein